MNKMKKGDEVLVIAGKDKGKRGVIASVINGGEKFIVEGINMVKKTVKANPQANEAGGIIDKAMPIHRSNVMIVDPNAKSGFVGSRVGIRVLNDGQRARYFKASDQLIEAQKA